MWELCAPLENFSVLFFGLVSVKSIKRRVRDWEINAFVSIYILYCGSNVVPQCRLLKKSVKILQICKESTKIDFTKHSPRPLKTKRSSSFCSEIERSAP